MHVEGLTSGRAHNRSQWAMSGQITAEPPSLDLPNDEPVLEAWQLGRHGEVSSELVCAGSCKFVLNTGPQIVFGNYRAKRRYGIGEKNFGTRVDRAVEIILPVVSYVDGQEGHSLGISIGPPKVELGE